MEVSDTLKKIAGTVGQWAPAIAGALTVTGVGAPVGAAVAAVGMLAKAYGLPETSSHDEVLAAVQSTTDPDIKLKLIQVNNDFILKQKDQELQELRIALDDVRSARQREIDTKDNTNKILAYVIIGAFVCVIAGTLAGYAKIDSVLAGTLIGYLSAKAEQVLTYYFGTTKGSEHKTELLARAPAIK